MLLTDSEKDSVLSTYRILLSRVMKKNFKAFQYIGSIYLTHVPHKYSKEMQKKSTVRTLPMIFKDEKKTENCVAILDETTAMLQEFFKEGKPNIFFCCGVIFF